MLRKITFPLSDYGELSLVNPSFRSPLFMSKHVEYNFSDHMTLFCGSHDNLFKITCLESNRFGYRGYFMVGECGRFFFTSCERR